MTNNEINLKKEYEAILQKMNSIKDDKLHMLMDKLANNKELYDWIYQRSESDIRRFAMDVVDIWDKRIKADLKKTSRANKAAKDISGNVENQATDKH